MSESIYYSEEPPDQIETFPWMKSGIKNAEALTAFDPPEDSEPQIYRKRRGSSRSGILGPSKKCLFYYLPGVIFGKQLHPK